MAHSFQLPTPPLPTTWLRPATAVFLLLLASTQGAAAQASTATPPDPQHQGAITPRADAADLMPRGGVVQPPSGTDPEMGERPATGDANMPVIQPPSTGVSDKQAERPPVPDR